MFNNVQNLGHLKKTKDNFPALNKGIYANTASAGLLGNALARWRQEHDNAYLGYGSDMKTKAMQTELPQTRTTVAEFFVCKPENVALVPNFSLGLNMLLEGMNRPHRVLLINDDYPSVNWPFEYRGCTLAYITMGEQFEHRIFERIKADNISMFVFSMVQWTNGIRMDMEFLRRLKAEFPDLILMADGTQFCGTTDFNFEECPLDILGASGYKWLLSGYGNGFLLFKDGVKPYFSPRTIGFNATDADLKGKDGIRFSKHFEPGHLDTLNFGSLRFSLGYLTDLGMPAIEKYLDELSEFARNAFADLELLERTVLNRKKHSTIFNIKGDDRLFRHLSDNAVICSQRGNGIRLSFHFYNSQEDVENIVRILKTDRYIN